MKKIVPVAVILALLLALIPAAAMAHTADDPYVTDLIAGGGNPASAIDAGDVLVWNDATYLYVKYVTVDGWCMTEAHLAVTTALNSIPQKNGNPIPGKFKYGLEFANCQGEYTYQIPLSEVDGNSATDLYIAAHAAVRKAVSFEQPNLDSFAAALPEQVTFTVQYPYIGAPSFFPATTVSGGTMLDGTYDGWSIDTDHVLYPSKLYLANVYSSYETLPDGLVEHPENLDLFNWIINQDFVGQISPGDNKPYSYGDVERAIWTLLEDVVKNPPAPWSQTHVDEIIAAAYANGEGFQPGCNDRLMVILQPVAEYPAPAYWLKMIIAIGLGLPCTPTYQSETAWAAGSNFPGANWAMYFNYTIQ